MYKSTKKSDNNIPHELLFSNDYKVDIVGMRIGVGSETEYGKESGEFPTYFIR